MADIQSFSVEVDDLFLFEKVLENLLRYFDLKALTPNTTLGLLHYWLCFYFFSSPLSVSSPASPFFFCSCFSSSSNPTSYSLTFLSFFFFACSSTSIHPFYQHLHPPLHIPTFLPCIPSSFLTPFLLFLFVVFFYKIVHLAICLQKSPVILVKSLTYNQV